MSNVSVIIPVRNGELYLQQVLESVLQQDVPLFECIVVDNNSTDTTAEIVAFMQTMYPNLIYVFEPKIGRGAARNAGVAISKGEIIVMTDVDCTVSEDWIRRLTAPIVAGEEVCVLGWQYDTAHTYWSTHMQKMYEYEHMDRVNAHGYVKYIDTKNFAISRRYLQENPFDIRLRALEDCDLEQRLKSRIRFRYLHEVQVGHRHPETLWAVFRKGFEQSYWHAQLYHKYKGKYDGFGELIFPVIPAFVYYMRLLKINYKALYSQGLSHLPFFLVSDTAWKIGSAIGYAHKDRSMR